MKRERLSSHVLVEGWNLYQEGYLDEDDDDDKKKQGDEGAGTDDNDADKAGADDSDDGENDKSAEDLSTPDDEREHAETPEDSLDNQIDAYLIKYEKMSMGDPDGTVDESRQRSPLMRFFASQLLREAGDDEDENSDDDVSSNAEPPAANSPPPLNIDEFAKRVARLMTNYDNLLDVPGAVFDRARLYLQQNYGDEIADQLADVLETQHDITVNDQKSEYPTSGPAAVGSQGTEEMQGGGGGFGLGGGTGGGGEG